MASRKSSASFARAAPNLETAGANDVLVFNGARPLQPERQPLLPPPIERQKDEGFTRFLKKHSSPTHNRVTAGGRIVPIEPRSPPPFVLSPNAADHTSAQPANQLLHQPVKKNGEVTWTTIFPYDQLLHASEPEGVNGNERYVHPAGNNIRDVDLVNHSSMQFGTPYGMQMAISSSVSPERMPLQGQLNGGPVMPPSAYGQVAMTNELPTATPNFGFGNMMVQPYTNEGTMDYTSQMNQPFGVQQGPTPMQTLMAWEQHYHQLDQQLKDIDKHRAMNDLDPRLADQRRVIVQQRSDAKDTVRDLQNMLGTRRRFATSPDSWNPSFNVEAPVYVPQSAVAMQANLAHRPSFESRQGFIEKPRGYGQRRAIPIRAPPENEHVVDVDHKTQSLHDSRQNSSASERWSASSKNEVPGLSAKGSSLSAQTKSTHSREDMAYSADTQFRVSTSASLHHDQEPNEETERVTTREVMVVHPPKDYPPNTLPEEYIVLIEAINRPKGTISKVRLLDNRVIDVEGQGLGLVSSPKPGSGLISNSSLDSTDATRTASFQDGTKRTTPLDTTQGPIYQIGKENLSVTPKGHQKAATDAFLAQFNAVDSNMALGLRPETQSLRTSSNSQLRQFEQKSAEYYHRGPLVSKENLPQLAHQNSSNLKRGLEYSVADERVFENGENDYVDQDSFNTKGYSITSVQNVHAIRSLPNSFDGVVEARQSIQAQLNAASKSRSPRFLRRFGANGGA